MFRNNLAFVLIYKPFRNFTRTVEFKLFFKEKQKNVKGIRTTRSPQVAFIIWAIQLTI